jgi:hypothetical protein
MNFSAFLLSGAFIAICACVSNEPAEQKETEPGIGVPQAPQRPAAPTPYQPVKEPVENATPSKEASGRTAWAEQYEGRLIRGLDGALYEPYNRMTIERTQRSLQDRGLYSGPINGILDRPTMTAIYAFQKASSHLQMCGVPTPRTRGLLEQGSHTDPQSPTR